MAQGTRVENMFALARVSVVRASLLILCSRVEWRRGGRAGNCCCGASLLPIAPCEPHFFPADPKAT